MHEWSSDCHEDSAFAMSHDQKHACPHFLIRSRIEDAIAVADRRIKCPAYQCRRTNRLRRCLDYWAKNSTFMDDCMRHVCTHVVQHVVSFVRIGKLTQTDGIMLQYPDKLLRQLDVDGHVQLR